MRSRVFPALFGVAVILVAAEARAQRWMEKLDRGVVAVNQGDGKVFVGWRHFATEPADIGYNVYRQAGNGAPVKVNDAPLTGPTWLSDAAVDLAVPVTYSVRAVSGGRELDGGRGFTLPASAPARNYLEIPLKLPQGMSVGDGSAADLDGDGQYEMIIKGISREIDSASAGIADKGILQAYKLDGTHLWTIQLGINIREGEHDTQFMVYDLDGDGKAELACRTSDGSADGLGKIIGQPDKDWREKDQSLKSYGKNMTGPEYLTIFDGLTGKELVSAPYVPNQFPQDGWGGIGGSSGSDTTGNRNMRFMACVAYLDGVRPSLVMCRGVYGRTVLAAWDWRDGKLTQRWIFDSATHPRGGAPYITAGASVSAARGLNKLKDYCGNWGDAKPGQAIIWDREGKKEYAVITAVDKDIITVNKELSPGEWKSTHVCGYSGMGGHSISVADVDEDGKDEIVYQSMIVDDNGQGYLTTGMRHGDALHVSDFDPSNPGLEVLGPRENEGFEWDQFTPASLMYSARTGDVLWGINNGQDAERTIASDLDPRHPGAEMWGMAGGLRTIKGEVIAPRGPGFTNFVIWWNGDLQREMVNGNQIARWNWETGRQETIFVAQGAQAAAGTKSSPVLGADLLGDWREECVFRSGNTLRIYTNTDPTDHRLYTLMQDPQYRLAITWQNVTYNQPPYPSFYIGEGMSPPPRPKIRILGQ